MSTNHSNKKRSVLYIAIIIVIALALYLVIRYVLSPVKKTANGDIASETTTLQDTVPTSHTATTMQSTVQSQIDNTINTNQSTTELIMTTGDIAQSLTTEALKETTIAAGNAVTLQETTAVATVTGTLQQAAEVTTTVEAPQEKVAVTAVNKTKQLALSKKLPNFSLGDSVDSVAQALAEKGLAYRVITNYLETPQKGVTGIIESESEIIVYQDELLDYSRIYQLQEQLKIAGYYTVIDGSFGPKTKAQMDAFCKAQIGTTYPNYNSMVEQELLTFNRDKMAGDIDDYLVYATKSINLRSTDVPSRLVPIGVPHASKVKQIEALTNQQLIKMFADAKQAGISLYVVSGYRSFDYQIGLFERYRQKNGFEMANRFSALPGQSEHQTGLVVDMVDANSNMSLDQSFEDTDAFKWLDVHAHQYGFILSYPKGKEAITGYVYEPWHYRFVGSAEVATDIKQRGLTLEQYVKERN